MATAFRSSLFQQRAIKNRFSKCFERISDLNYQKASEHEHNGKWNELL